MLDVSHLLERCREGSLVDNNNNNGAGKNNEAVGFLETTREQKNIKISRYRIVQSAGKC